MVQIINRSKLINWSTINHQASFCQEASPATLTRIVHSPGLVAQKRAGNRLRMNNLACLSTNFAA